MVRRSGLCFALAGVACLVSFASTAFAQTEPGLAFAQSGTLSISWEALGKGKEVSLCNGGDQIAEPIDVSLAGFGFKAGEKDLEPSEVVSVTAPSEGVPAGACRLVSLALKSASVTSDAGEYEGTIAVAAPGMGVAQLAVSISGPGVVTKPAAVNGAVEEATLSATNSSPWSRPELDGDADLLLKPPASDESMLTIGEGCEQRENGSWNAKCPFIGNLYQGSDIIRVFVAGEIVHERGVERLPVRIRGPANAVGDYEGVLDPSLTGDKEQGVKTKLTATDAVCWAILALLLGTAISLGMQVWSGRSRPKRLLELRREDLVKSYEQACGKVNCRKKISVELNGDEVEKYADEIKEAIKRYTNSVLLVDTSSDAYKEIEKSLAIAEADIEALVAEDGLEKAQLGLQAAVTATEKLLADNHLVVQAPELLSSAKALFTGTPFAVGDATERAKQAGELTASLGTWGKLAKRVMEDEAWLFALAQRAEQSQPEPVSDKDKEILTDTAIRLREVHEELFRATGDADLERLRVSARIETAYSQLSYLAEKYGVNKPAAAPVTILRGGLYGKVKSRFVRAFDLSGSVTAANIPDDARELVSTVASAVSLPAARYRLLLGDAFALVVAVAVAIFTGLTAFYFGKAFGTWQDYATVIVIGSAAQVVAKAILDSLSTFVHDISPRAEPKPPETEIVAPAT